MKGVPAEYGQIQMLINSKYLTEDQAKMWYVEAREEQ
jgi:hypothetical protein